MGDEKNMTQRSESQHRIAREIEAVFERFYKERSAYSKGHFYKNEFFLRNDYALVVLKNDRDIFMSFSDRTPPSYAALFTLLLDGIPATNLYICEDYSTDDTGSMVCDEEDLLGGTHFSLDGLKLSSNASHWALEDYSVF